MSEPDRPVVLRHRREGFLEELELRSDGTFRHVCDYHVIYGGQYDEDDVIDAYTGVWRTHAGGVVVLEVRWGERRVIGSGNRFDLGREPPELLAFLDVAGGLASLVHIAAPRRGAAALSLADEQAFFAGGPLRDRFACPCGDFEAHALRRTTSIDSGATGE